MLYDLTYTGCHNGQLQSPMLTLIVLAPAWIAAFDYMTLGRLINTFLPSKSALGLRARRITLIFVFFDILLVDTFFFFFSFFSLPYPHLTHSPFPRHPRLNLLFDEYYIILFILVRPPKLTTRSFLLPFPLPVPSWCKAPDRDSWFRLTGTTFR